MRLGALAPSHCPTMPPIDSPHQLIFCNAETVEHGEHVAAEPLHRIGPFRHAGFAVAAAVVAHEAEVAA